ncbi:MAG: tRNA pseudouridine(55) synthase TruB [Patescibacteria group bacterium]
MTSGFLLINKPPGPTSHDVVDAVRNIIHNTHPYPSQEGTTSKSPPPEGWPKAGVGSMIRVGHAGTLDPFAAGLLIIGVGRDATKQLDNFKNLPKTYVATIRLGAISDTDDGTGHIEELGIKNFELSFEKIEKILHSFVGEIDQIPPMYSAKKIKGEKLYELARQGKTIERQPQRVTIHSIQLLEIENWKLKIKVHCSPGTYVRALARDIGERLGCGAYCEELTRTAIGPFTLNESVHIEELKPDNWMKYLITFQNLEARIKKYGEYLSSFPFDSSFQLPTSPVRVLVFGTFDLLHPGHLDFFRQAKKLGDRLIVGVGRDQVVAALKGKPPRQSEQVRLTAVRECGLVDEAHLLPKDPQERYAWIKKINSSVIALGYDQTAFTEHLAEDLAAHDIYCKVVRLQSYYPERYKSSKMKPI